MLSLHRVGAARAARALLVAAVVLAAAVLTGSLGVQAVLVRSGSMAPAIRAGDALVVRPVAAASVAVGDVVTFPDPHRPGRTLTHRVVQASSGGPGRPS